MFCPSCGANVGAARFCPSCGAQTGASQPLQSPLQPGAQPPASRSLLVPVALAGLAVGVVIVLLVGVLLLRGTPSSDPTAGAASAAAAPSETTSSPSEEASPTRQARPRRVKTVTAAPTPVPGDVRGLPAGLFCRDLNARGYSYVAAIDYWRMHGQPNQMDADRNGIPCETVYPASDVAAYWGGQSLPGMSLTSGLFCRDLYVRGYSYPEAVAYWWLEGAPDRMDADLNGIPCETVYPAYAVDEYWY
jgi:hypothetical protein